MKQEWQVSSDRLLQGTNFYGSTNPFRAQTLEKDDMLQHYVRVELP